METNENMLLGTPDELVSYFTRVREEHAVPAIQFTPATATLTIPAGPWGPAATVYFGQPWVLWGAICIGPEIFLSGSRTTAGVLAHEYTHTLQTERVGGFEQYLRAWAEHTARDGYLGNPFEVEAFDASNVLERELARWRVRDDKAYGPGDLWHPAWLEPGSPGMLRYAGREYRNRVDEPRLAVTASR